MIISNSCNTKKTRHVVKNEYYGNDQLKSKISYLDDTMKDGESSYYDSSGDLVKREYFKMGKKDSVAIDYYRSGKTSDSIIFYKSYPISHYEFYTNGTIKKYFANSFEGRTFYLVDYDTAGLPHTDVNYSICPSYGIKGYGRDNGRSELLYVNDTLTLTFLVAQPPDCDERVQIGVYKVTQAKDTSVKHPTLGKQIYIPFGDHPITTPGVRFTSVFKEKGIYQIICAGGVLAKNSIFPKRDTVVSIWKVE